MTENDPIKVIETSKDPGELASAAVRLARSDNPDDHGFLGQVLQTPEFLSRLDSEQDYAQPRGFLRVASVIKELDKNEAASARTLLIKLMQSPVFIEAPSRAELLIEASESIRPAPPEVAVFWEKHSDPDDVYMNMLMRALIANGSTPALELFEKKITDSQYTDKKKISWFRTEIPPHRNKPAVLDACSRMLHGGMAESLKIRLVEVLFNFQPSWFRPSTPVTCAPFSAFDSDERSKLQSIAEYALKDLELPEPLEQAVNDTLKELKAAENE